MVIVGVLLILAVLLDAWRRVYQDQRAPLRMKLNDPDDEEGEPKSPRKDIDLAWLRELPNGGARVVERGENDEPPARDENTPAGSRAPSGARAEQRGAPAPASDAGQDNSQPSQARDVSRPAEVRGAASSRSASPQPAEAAPAAASHSGSPAARTPSKTGSSAKTEPPASVTGSSAKTEPPASVSASSRGEGDVDLLAGMSGSDEPENLDWLDALEAEQRRETAAPSSRVTAQLPRDVQPEVFMLNVVARHASGFRGDDILHILLACDLRFGDMSFFHRHEQEAGRGPIQFSVANMMQPGVFDIDNMSDFNTPGLVFFVTLPGPEDMMKAFDYMLETAQAVARNLEGDVLDETRSVLTRQTLEHSRQQIRDLERRLLAKAR